MFLKIQTGHCRVNYKLIHQKTMSEYSPKTLIVIALALVTEGGYRGDNPLMEKPEIKTLVTKIQQQLIIYYYN